MKQGLKIAVLPIDIALGDKTLNMQRVKDAMTSIAPDTDVVVLPELFSTGFTSNRDKLELWAEGNGGDTITELNVLAKKYHVAIAGSFLARTGSMALFNRAFFIEPGGDETFYDKRHLFSMSAEAQVLEGGRRCLPVARYRGWNIAVAICYDLRFPVWCRNIGLKYDLLLVVANWPSAREYAWRHLLIARAIENQSYVCGVNRSGCDKFGDYGDTSFVADFCGKLVDLIAAPDSDIKYADLSLSTLKKWRNDFSVWQDSDDFEVNL